MEHEINITIDGIAYKRVEAKHPEMQCEECDWRDLCADMICMCNFCLAFQKIEPLEFYIFKKVK